jgi:single-strand DNA-binding protein
MRRGLNKVTLIGVLGADPEMRFSPTGRPVTSFGLATDEDWIGADGVRRHASEWFTVVAWGELAERCQRALGKNSWVYVEGRLQTRSWEDEQGNRNAMTEVVASDFIALAPSEVDE